jgi:hypothetical protein
MRAGIAGGQDRIGGRAVTHSDEVSGGARFRAVTRFRGLFRAAMRFRRAVPRGDDAAAAAALCAGAISVVALVTELAAAHSALDPSLWLPASGR